MTAPDTLERSLGDLEENITRLETQVDNLICECRHLIAICIDAEEVLAYLPSAIEPFPGYSRTIELVREVLARRHTHPKE